MISYKEKIADVLAPQIEGLEKEEILSVVSMVSTRTDY